MASDRKNYNQDPKLPFQNESLMQILLLLMYSDHLTFSSIGRPLMNFFSGSANIKLNGMQKKGYFLETVIIFIQYCPGDKPNEPAANGT